MARQSAAAVKEAEARAAIEGEGSKAVDYQVAGLDEEFATLVRDRQRLDAKIKELTEAKAAITDDIFMLVADCGHKSVGVDDFRVTYVEGKAPTRKLDPKLVLKIPGVTAAKLAACFVEGAPGKPYVLVTEAK